jgi:hypothetical protein
MTLHKSRMRSLVAGEDIDLVKADLVKRCSHVIVQVLTI